MSRNITKIIVKNVGQANWIELLDENDDVCIVFDMGIPRLEKTTDITTQMTKRYDRLEIKPIFVLSHWHADHYHAILSLGHRITQYFGQIVYPYPCPKHVTIDRILKLFEKCDIVSKIKLNTTGADINYLGTCTNVSLYKSRAVGKENNRCLALVVESDRNVCFLTGDMRYDFVNEIIKNKVLDCTKNFILIIPHHGGEAGKLDVFQNAKFLKAIISVGDNNIYGHPTNEVINVLQKSKTTIEQTSVLQHDITINL